jgi:hypothetical protein
MRVLMQHELGHVAGGGGKSSCHCGCKSKSKGNNGYGNGGHDGVPGKSGKQDRTR